MFDMTSRFPHWFAFPGLDVASLTVISNVAKVNPSRGRFLLPDADLTTDINYIW